jgi:hypothetical protein
MSHASVFPRSEVEGSAVRPSASRILRNKPQHSNRIVIPTEAKRSGGTCCSNPPLTALYWKHHAPLCHPDRSVAKWRDLRCAPRPSQIPRIKPTNICVCGFSLWKAAHAPGPRPRPPTAVIHSWPTDASSAILGSKQVQAGNSLHGRRLRRRVSYG